MTGEKSHIVIDGISSIRVDGGDLVIRHGIPRGEQEITIPRIERTIKRIIIPSRHGEITWDAFDWLRTVGISLYLIRDGKLMCHADNSFYDANLRRAQARAIDSRSGIDITRYLLSKKLAGQRIILDELKPSAVPSFDAIADTLAVTAEIPMCRNLEGAAANVYWDAWSDLTLAFKGPKPKTHWLTFGTRKSPLTASPRSAVTPLNAILNYAYAVLEGETIMACHALGLDPAMGLFHTDYLGRPSMALDMMEVGRPAVDMAVLDFVNNRVFTKREFYESDTGVTRLDITLHKHIAGLVTDIVPDCYRDWEWVANRLVADANGKTVRKRTPLTQANRRRRVKRT